MIDKKIESAINEQINAEFFSAFLYLSMSAYFAGQNLNGFANWMMVQYKEESAHAMKFINFLNERGGKVELKSIERPGNEWNSPLHVFEETLKHEEIVTSLINNLVDLSIQQKDHATNNFLRWYVQEQVEEESNATNIIGKLKMIKDSMNGLYLIDQELGQRVFVDPLLATAQN